MALGEVLLVRHGETVWNQERRRQGQLDSPLTPQGVLQAERAGDVVAMANADAIFTSPLGRTVATARIIAARSAPPDGLPVQVLTELAEVHHGRFAGLTNDEIELSHPGELDRRRSDRYRWRFPGGESYEDADHRGGTALARIEATGSTRPVLVTHEMLARTIIRRLLDLGTDDALARHLEQGAVYRIRPASRSIARLHDPERPESAG